MTLKKKLGRVCGNVLYVLRVHTCFSETTQLGVIVGKPVMQPHIKVLDSISDHLYLWSDQPI